MPHRTVFNDLSHLADTLEELATTIRRIESATRQSAQHAEVERLEEHLRASELDFGAIKNVGSEALHELGEILGRLGQMVSSKGDELQRHG